MAELPVTLRDVARRSGVHPATAAGQTLVRSVTVLPASTLLPASSREMNFAVEG